ncbi:MAG: glycosyltransferase family 39 protein [Myxococcota bacterium]
MRLDRYGPWLILVVFASVGLATVGDYGVTTDEPWRMLWSREWMEALRTGRVEQYSRMPGRECYGVLYDLLGRTAWLAHHRLGGTDEFFARHVLNLAAGCAALLGTHRLARTLAGPRVAVVAMLLLAVCPRFLGSAFANPKDIPFTAAAVWAAWASCRLLRNGTREAHFVAAALASLCAAVRPFGVVFFGVAAVAAFVAAEERSFGARIVRALGVLTLAYLGCMMLWPVLWVRPPWHLVSASLDLTQHVHGSRSLFFGELHPFFDAPGAYVVTWLGITLPLAVVFGAPVGLAMLGVAACRLRPRMRTAFGWVLLSAWVAGPALLPFLRRTTLYDTSRHLLFIVPPLCIFAALAWVHWARCGPRARVLAVAFVSLSSVASARESIALHPYQSLYFNELVGGIAGARGRFDVAHYSETYREGFRWLAEHHPGAAVHVVGNGSANASYQAWKFGLRLNTADFEFFLSEVRQGWESTVPGEVVHTIARRGVPLLEIRRAVPMVRPRVAYVWRGRNEAGLPAPPDRVPGWAVVESDDGRFDIDAVLQGRPGFIAVGLRTPTRAPTRLLLCHYLGLTAWLDGREIYDRKTVPFQYRATENFPSVNPVFIPSEPGVHWLVADVTEARQHWKFGVYAPASDVEFVQR